MQAKLTISEPGDQYEQEADRVAETVMRMPEPIGSEGVAVSGRVKDVHTEPVGSADAEKLHRQTMDEEMPEEEEETLQAKEVSGETPEVTPELEARLNSARGSGQPLPESVRAFFEPRFGYDFGGVRVHTDGQAVDSARSVKARAYTLGQDIVFGSGQYAPETPAGKQLLAHELTHVVQQTGAMASTAGHRSAGSLAPSVSLHPSQSGTLERKCVCGGAAGSSGECEDCSKRLDLQTKLKVSEPGDVYEQETDRIADQVMAAPAHRVVSGAQPRIQRLGRQVTTTGQVDAAPASVDQVHASPGRPALPQDMEQRFGHDFSGVRVHSGAAAEPSAQDVNGYAYTVGRNMVFGVGRFAAGTHQGRRLIAHELTRTVQQSGSDGIRIGQRNEKRGLSPITPAPARSIQRDDDPKGPRGSGQVWPFEVEVAKGAGNLPQSPDQFEPESSPTKYGSFDLDQQYWEAELVADDEAIKAGEEPEHYSIADDGWEIIYNNKQTPYISHQDRLVGTKIGEGEYRFSILLGRGHERKLLHSYGGTGLAPAPREKGTLEKMTGAVWDGAGWVLDKCSWVHKGCTVGSAAHKAISGDYQGAIIDIGLETIGKWDDVGSAGKAAARAKKRLPRYQGKKPKYHVNPAHVKGSSLYNPSKSPLPRDAEKVYKKAVPDDPKDAQHWYGVNDKGVVYRFSNANDGTVHYSGKSDDADDLGNVTDYALRRLGKK